MRRGAFTAVAAAMTFGLLVAGCSDGEDGTHPPPSTSGGQSVAETTTPSPTKSVQPPEMPAAAKKADVDGARAFIAHYFTTLNYAYKTGDLTATQPLRQDQCLACLALEETVKSSYGRGGSIQGGELGVGEITVTPGEPEKGLSAAVFLSQKPGRLISSDGKPFDDIPASPEERFSVLVEYRGEWQVVEMGTNDAA